MTPTRRLTSNGPLERPRVLRSVFWYAEGGYLYDVIERAERQRCDLRPNQLLALSLAPGAPRLLSHKAAISVLNVCAKELVTSVGLRSLAPTHADYAGIFCRQSAGA